MSTAVITGGAKRIGRSIAIALAEKGYDIVLHYRSSQAEAQKVCGKIEQTGHSCILIKSDFSNHKDVMNFMTSIAQSVPSCDLLVNNASIFERASFLETDETLFDRHFQVNFKAPFFLSQAFVKQFHAGHIINILDTKISRNLTSYFAYTLTKKLLASFTQMAARELGPQIRVNGICPGLILPAAGSNPEDFEKMGTKIPLEITGGPEAIVKAVQFLIDNTYVTGEIIYVDGGEHLI